MRVIHARCAGLDVGKDNVVAGVRLASGSRVKRDVQTFGTTTSQLLKLLEWLKESKCTHVVMEATGVYWKPVWHVLEGEFELVLANAAHVKNVPGRKTDVRDAEWLADLLAHGLVRSSLVPPEPIQELRDLTRTRKQLVREVVQHTQRIQKTLEDANIKLTGTISDVLGASGRAMIQAIIAGESDPERLANLANPRVKASRAELIEALRGRIRKRHRFLLKLHLQQVNALEQAIEAVEDEIDETLAPFRPLVELLVTIPGFSVTTAQSVLAEIGVDMSRFASDAQIRSWAGLCPRNDESAGKRRSVRLRKGNTWLKTTLVQAAWAALRTKDTYPAAQFHRLRARRGAKKAIMAVAASLLTAAYHILKNQVPYHDLGSKHFDHRDKSRVIRRLVSRLQELGCTVNIDTAA